jgi:hypothetical protein
MKKRIGFKASAFRKPNGQWQVNNAARWFEKLLGISPGCVVFMRPDGKPAKPTETIGSLRAKSES